MPSSRNDAACCRVCGSDDLRSLGTCPSFEKSEAQETELAILDPGELFVCQICGIALRIPCPSEDVLRTLYSTNEPHQCKASQDYSRAWVLVRNQLLKTAVSRRTLRVLDIGASSGVFLRSLPESWERCAIEPSQAAQTVLKDNRIVVVSDDIADPRLESLGGFDAVTMFDVFEHLPDPLDYIKRSLALLKSGGVLYVSTGNFSCPLRKWLGVHHWYFRWPQHITFCTEPFLKWLSANRIATMKVRRIAHAPSRSGAFSEWRSAFYFGLRYRGGIFGLLAKAFLRLPRFRQEMHRNRPSASFHLRDHLLVTLQRDEMFCRNGSSIRRADESL